MPIYRYRKQFDISGIQKRVPGTPTYSTASSEFIDLSLSNAAFKTDLDNVMLERGYAYETTDPTSSPNQTLVTEIGASGTLFDPRRILWRDHFITGNPGDIDEFGAMGWRTQTSGTGSNVTIIDGIAGRAGICRIEGGTTATARGVMFLGDSTLANTVKVTSSQNQIDFGFTVRPISSIGVLDLERVQVGLGSEWTIDAELANGLYWRYTPGTDTAWTLVAANRGVRTSSASSVAPVVNTWAHLAVRITYPGGVPTVQGYVNGAASGSAITTNLPSNAVSPGVMVQSVGSIVLEPMLDIDDTYGYQDVA